MAEAVFRIRTGHVIPMGFAVAVQAALVGMAGNLVCIRPNKNGVVNLLGRVTQEFPALIQQAAVGKIRDNFRGNMPLPDEVRINPGACCRWHQEAGILPHRRFSVV